MGLSFAFTTIEEDGATASEEGSKVRCETAVVG